MNPGFFFLQGYSSFGSIQHSVANGYAGHEQQAARDMVHAEVEALVCLTDDGAHLLRKHLNRKGNHLVVRHVRRDHAVLLALVEETFQSDFPRAGEEALELAAIVGQERPSILPECAQGHRNCAPVVITIERHLPHRIAKVAYQYMVWWNDNVHSVREQAIDNVISGGKR